MPFDAVFLSRLQFFWLFLLPIIVMYTGWSYWVFRGKVRAGSGYH